MMQSQQSASMPKEWYDQLYELAYGRPADTRPVESDKAPAEDSNAVKWSLSAVLRFVPVFRA